MNNDNDNELLLAGLVIAFLLPLATISEGVRAWLLTNHILVPAAEAVVSVQSWNVGLDWPRLLIAIFILALLLTLTTATLRRRRAKHRSRRS